MVWSQLNIAVQTRTLLVGATAFLFSYWLLSARRRRKKLPPGPPAPSIVYGHAKRLRDNDMTEGAPVTLTQWSRDFGEFYTIRMGSQDSVVLSGFRIMREMLEGRNGISSHGRPLSTAGILKFVWGDIVLPRGLIMNEGEDWKRMRIMSLKAFSTFGVGRKSLERRIQDEAEALVALFETLPEGQAFNPKKMFDLVFSNVICSVVFGERFDLNDKEFNEFTVRLHRVFENSGLVPEIFVPYLIPFVTRMNPKLAQFLADDTWVFRYVQSKIRDHRRSYSPDVIRSCVDLFLQAIDRGGLNTADDELNMARAVKDLFIAGAESSSAALYWIILNLVRCPDVQDKCQSEIAREVGPARPPCYADRRKLPFTEATLLEVLRVATIAVYGVMHRTVSEINIRGFVIPKDTAIITNYNGIHNDPDYWGDPEKFRPDRWLDPEGHVIKHEAFLPFSTGPRQCLGKSLALQELFIVMVTLLQRYTFRPEDPENLPPTRGIPASVFIPHPYRVIVSKV